MLLLWLCFLVRNLKAIHTIWRPPLVTSCPYLTAVVIYQNIFSPISVCSSVAKGSSNGDSNGGDSNNDDSNNGDSKNGGPNNGKKKKKTMKQTLGKLN